MAVSKLDLLYSTEREALFQPGIPRADALVDPSPARPCSAQGLIDTLLDLSRRLRHLDVRFDADLQAVWCFQRHPGRPCFSLGLLEDVRELQAVLMRTLRAERAGSMPVSYLIWASSLPGVYNLGGDLAYFCDLVRAKDAAGLHDYARRCVDICHINAASLDLPIQTVALVQGDALGGGFESVLSNDLIIAEEGAKFGLPEVVFNLFPGMGAYSFLCRRLDAARARSMIMSGRLYEAEELHEMGLIDVLCPKGQGEQELRRFIERNRRRQNLLTAMAASDDTASRSPIGT
ncbi:MAG: enoyl-CoA hydratase [Rhizobiales bacterium]|nr:enoyl-CoA hydratase [Hyphomicrobiales bacterium]